MGLFGAGKTYELPPGNPAEWTPLNVKHWIKHIGMAKHRGPFRVLNGEQLLQLSEAECKSMCNGEADGSYVFKKLLRLRGEPSPRKAAPATAAKERATQYLFQWAGEDATISEFKEFLDGAGTVTVGLMTACERMAPSAAIGIIVGTVFKIYKSSRDAQVNIYNCRILRYLCVDILRAFHSAGTEKLASAAPNLFEEVKAQLETALLLVRSCSKPGWLVRMAFAGRIDEEFSAIHEGIAAVLQESGLDDLYGHAKLPAKGDYTDCCASLHAVLKNYDDDIRVALTKFAETGQGYESIKTALSCDDEGLRMEMGYIMPALAVIDKMLPKRPSTPPLAPVPTARRSPRESSLGEPHGRGDGGSDVGGEPQEPPAGHKETSMYDLFLAFCNFGTRLEALEMDGARFSKFCRDCRIVGRDLPSTEVDLIFTRVKPVGQRRIVYEEFVEALTLIADRKGVPLKELTEGILACGGPTATGTKAAYTRLHDDKGTYTGVYARGGPSSVDVRLSLDKVVLRTDPREHSTPRLLMEAGGAATPRGTARAQHAFTPRGCSGATPRRAAGPVGDGAAAPHTSHHHHHHHHEEEAESQRSSLNTSDTPGRRASARAPRPASGTSKSSTPGSAPRLPRSMATTPRSSLAGGAPGSSRPGAREPSMDVPWQDPDARAELLRVYNAFASFGSSHAKMAEPASAEALEMENKQFVKLVKDAGLTGGELNVTRLDIIFSKVKAKGRRKINFPGFERALAMLAGERRLALSQIYNSIVSTAGPQLNHVTTPEFVKYHDDKNTYTGVYARGGPSNTDERITLDRMVVRNDDIYHFSRTPRFVA